MAIFDIVIVVFVTIGAIIGLCHGFFKELVSTVGLLVAALIANWLSPFGQSYFMVLFDNETAARVLAWIIIFMLLMLAMHGIAYLLGKLMQAVSLGWINRCAGALFGLVKYLLIAALVVLVLDFACKHISNCLFEPYMKESKMVPYILRFADSIWKMF